MAGQGVIDRPTFEMLHAAGRLMHDLTQILRLSLDHPFDPATSPAGLKALLATAAGAESFDSLERRLKAVLSIVHKAFDDLVT